MIKYVVAWAVMILVTTAASAQTPTQTETEQQLLAGKWWGGGINTSPPASIAFLFARDTDGVHLGAKIFYKEGRVGYEAYSKGQRYAGDTEIDPSTIGWSRVTFDKDGSFTLANKFIWKFTKTPDGNFQCVRTTTDARQFSVNPFIIRKLPPG